MPEPTIVTVMSDFRRQVQQGEDVALREMSRRWLQVERALTDQITLLAREMTDLRAAGKVVNLKLVLLMEHSESMLLQTRQQIVQYAAYADSVITERQREMARLGIEHASQAIQTVSARAVFSRLNIAAVESIIGLAGNGSPLRTLLEATYGDAANGILDILIRGVAIGKNPRTMAKQAVREGLSKSMDRMMVIFRTESLRVYRHTSLETYRQSGIVEYWIWKCSLSRRTCAGCLSMDGSRHSIDEPFASHVQCRCAPIPKCFGVDAPVFHTGEEWLAKQDEDVQRDILGPGRLAAYKKGVPFERFATVQSNPTWGDSVQATPLRDLR